MFSNQILQHELYELRTYFVMNSSMYCGSLAIRNEFSFVCAFKNAKINKRERNGD